MAQRTVVVLSDDLAGGDADETVRFSLDGQSYEIDLTTKHAKELRDALARYVAAGRKTQAPRGRGAGRRQSRGAALSGLPESGLVREWARQQGHEVSDRGRVPLHLVEKYQAANS